VTTAPGDAVERLIHEEYPRILATLIRVTGDVDMAQDAVQDAVVRALETWPRDGVPQEPRAWLTVVARRRAIDRVRRESSRAGREAEAVWLLDPDPEEPPESVVRDDLLRLVFTCCHPALSREAQVALSLRTLGGLSTAEVARALLVPESTMAKRLTRAKQKISRARIPYRIPADHELPDRLDGVLTTLYLIFNEGYAASSSPDVVRVHLVDEALRMTALLHRLMPDEPSVMGLLSLELLQDSRRPTRVNGTGTAVRLRDQERSRWNRDQIREGVLLLGEALHRTPNAPDAFVVQAAIAACHALAPTYAATDWDAIVSWYDVLLKVEPSDVVRLGRASAIAERDGAEVGLVEVDSITGLDEYAWWHGSRAELLIRLGRVEEARAAREQAEMRGLSTAHLHSLDSTFDSAPAGN
jgi:RNA polymerase sigma-70 factor (ECF subfamily)